MSSKKQLFRWISYGFGTSTLTRLVVLTGARQVGKTTWARRHFNQLPYYNLDSLTVRMDLTKLPAEQWGKTVGNAVLDEIQKEPSLFDKLKYSYDEKSISSSLLLGSSQILLLHNIRESLAGRVFVYELFPLMASEILLEEPQENPSLILLESLLSDNPVGTILSNIPAVWIGEKGLEVQQTETYLLKWGGMPELLTLSDREKEKWLAAYEISYLEKDLADLVRLHDLNPFKKLQRLVGLRSGQLLSYSELAKEANLSVDTVRRYLEYLRLSYQVILLSPYHENFSSIVIKTPKVYAMDVGILRQVTGFWGESTGALYETYVVSEIYKWIKTLQTRVELYFYRTRSGMEVDMLIKINERFLGIEIKNRERIDKSDISSLKALASTLKEKWIGGLCIYTGNHILNLDKNWDIWAVPSYRLFASKNK